MNFKNINMSTTILATVCVDKLWRVIHLNVFMEVSSAHYCCVYENICESIEKQFEKIYGVLEDHVLNINIV